MNTTFKLVINDREVNIDLEQIKINNLNTRQWYGENPQVNLHDVADAICDAVTGIEFKDGMHWYYLGGEAGDEGDKVMRTMLVPLAQHVLRFIGCTVRNNFPRNFNETVNPAKEIVKVAEWLADLNCIEWDGDYSREAKRYQAVLNFGLAILDLAADKLAEDAARKRLTDEDFTEFAETLESFKLWLDSEYNCEDSLVWDVIRGDLNQPGTLGWDKRAVKAIFDENPILLSLYLSKTACMYIPVEFDEDGEDEE